ncbi:MAG: NDP-sugar synthase, partial [Clostridia bacterium]|nr:NDP-sugar synthase [Clostridia bacterium]
MKACILAGGLGTRLRPLTHLRPKPMMPLFDRPVMEYALALLKSQGVEECMIPLLYLPEVIRGYFGDEYDGIR